MDKGRIQRLISLQEELTSITPISWSRLQAWVAKATPIVRSDWPDFFSDFQALIAEPRWTSLPRVGGSPNSELVNARSRETEQKSNQQKIDAIQQNILAFISGLILTVPHTNTPSVLSTLLFMCKRFPRFARQLAIRLRGRTAIQIEDEYDVQYVMLALLRLHFDDVCSEESTPSYAGGSSQLDFLLSEEQYGIEVKKTRTTLRDADIGAQLLVDIERYAQHHRCKTLICFVYDPDSFLDNPRGLERDLSGHREKIEVIVVVSPS
jgi:hypothetical protein